MSARRPAPYARKVAAFWRRIFEIDGSFTHDSLARFLGRDRSLVSHWVRGDRDSYVGDLLALLMHADAKDQAAIMQVLADAVGADVVVTAAGPVTEDVTRGAMAIGAGAGQVLAVASAATADGEVDAEEAEALDAAMAMLASHIEGLRRRVRRAS